MNNICIVGGLGTVGTITLEKLLLTNVQRIKIFDCDENAMNIAKRKYKDNRIVWYIGDIRNFNSISNSLFDMDAVILCAALKHVSTGQDYPMEAVRTNVIGTQNVIDACIRNNINNLVFISTDKSVEPSNIYGMTKHISERLVLNEKNLNTCVVRSGNILNSRGSVIPKFRELKRQGKQVPLTDINMKRYVISKDDIAKLILLALFDSIDKQIYIPKMKQIKIIDIIKKLDCSYYITGIQDGEKLEEKIMWNYEKAMNVYSKEIEYFIVKGD